MLIGEGFVVSILEDTPTATATFAGSISGQSLPFPRSRKRHGHSQAHCRALQAACQKDHPRLALSEPQAAHQAFRLAGPLFGAQQCVNERATDLALGSRALADQRLQGHLQALQGLDSLPYFGQLVFSDAARS